MENTIYYKGFNTDMKCKNIQFALNKITTDTIEPTKVNIRNRGLHFSKTLKEASLYYPLKSSIFAIVTPISEVKLEGTLGVCHSLKVERMLTEKEILDIIEKEKSDERDKIFKLDIVRELHIENPLLIIGGSIALYLFGVNLKRDTNGTDFDIILPFYSKIKYKGKSLQALNDKSSGNDFCETAYVEGIKVDILVNPNLSYEEITYKGFEYKVNNLYNILEAKLKYAKAGNEKHIIDIKTMLGIKEDANDSLINALSTWK